MSSIKLIAKERKRQVDKEGWSSEHDDDEHRHGGLVWAAICYAASSIGEKAYKRTRDARWGEHFLEPWPWDGQWDKRKKHSRKRKLVIAGALIAAEIDRLLREEQTPAVKREDNA